MTRSEYIEKLEALYEFEHCGHKGCRKHEQCTANGKITGPKEPFIGSKYGEDGLTRLVFLSLDPGSIDESKDLSLNRTEDGDWIAKRAEKTHHWWRMLQIAYSILGKKKLLSDASDEEIAEGVNSIAHLNSARCSQNKTHRREADSILFTNCREFVIRELEILKPEILITQGERAWDVIRDWAAPAQKEELAENTDTYLRRFEIVGQPCRHVHLYHPSYIKGYSWQHHILVESGVLKAKLAPGILHS